MSTTDDTRVGDGSSSPDNKNEEAGHSPSPSPPNMPTAFSDSDAEDAANDAALGKGQVDPIYERKARVLNAAIQDIGMGWYQWQLFIVTGFGWSADNLWPIVTSLILTPITNEFLPTNPEMLTLAQNIGLLAGAVFWGFGCDVFGRRWAFNLTLGLAAVWGMIAASAPSFAAIGCFAALWSFGVGGNLPVDSAIFLEFLPGSHQWLLTVLSIDWALAQVIANLVAWPLLGYMTCQETATTCTRQDNIGWRYFMVAMGGLTLVMFAVRFGCFTIFESPKYHMGKGEDEKAVAIVHEVARRNGVPADSVWLTLDHLRACEPDGYVASSRMHQRTSSRSSSLVRGSGGGGGDSRGAEEGHAMAAIKRKLEALSLDHVRALFASRKLGYSTAALMFVWAFIGLGYPLYNAFLPYIQSQRGLEFGDGSTYITYRNSLIIAAVGVPGALVGGVLVELPNFGRKGALSLGTVLTGVFLYGSTTAESSSALLGWNCAYNFTSNVMYAVLYAFTPEVFPTKDRGTGNALTATANRIFGIMAPIIAMFANLETAAPVYTSGALFIAAGCIVLTLPFESRGKASL